MIEVTVPNVGESITEVQIGQWLKAPGDWVNEGEDIVEIETEKASVQIPAAASGYLREQLKKAEEFAVVGETIARIEPAGNGRPNAASESSGAAASSSQGSASSSPGHASSSPGHASSSPGHASSSPGHASSTQGQQAATAQSSLAPAAAASAAAPQAAPQQSTAAPAQASAAEPFIMPAAQRLIDDLGLAAADIPASGPGGRMLKEDVQRYVAAQRGSRPAVPQAPPVAAPPQPAPGAMTAVASPSGGHSLLSTQPHREEELKPMSMLRRTIAARLVQAQQTAALLTTFNEVDMQSVMQLRNKYRDSFASKHGVKLGFMSFFAKAAVEALRRFPAVNAEIRGNGIVYRHYQDIGIAIGGGKGLVVPILRNVERMSFADIERAIADFATAATENRLQPQDLEGGTFTISNGGIYGSLLSTPIVNPPQSGILGLHSIQERPIALGGEVVIRPMMYLALTYDHRIVDGREAVSFLRTIKEVIEDPSRLFLEV